MFPDLDALILKGVPAEQELERCGARIPYDAWFDAHHSARFQTRHLALWFKKVAYVEDDMHTSYQIYERHDLAAGNVFPGNCRNVVLLLVP